MLNSQDTCRKISGKVNNIPKMTKVTLVQRKDKLYPRTSEDYTFLKSIGYPMYHIDTSFLSLLARNLKAHKVVLEKQSFSELEATMLEKLAKQFPHAITLSKDTLVFHSPSDYSVERLESLAQKLKAWYAKHYVSFTFNLKTGRKTTKLILIFKDDLNDS